MAWENPPNYIKTCIKATQAHKFLVISLVYYNDETTAFVIFVIIM